ncbi:hypothetical protein AVEN_205431-1 [Araneus ventricosus]|uniref:Uncharacterized protein n=1 Tax=Araneus ventricosus TaxID=182803 RepID=A0A4Y2C7T6_ARAVE|nr:hypothetical protein AVEN_193676-1 [Araneus ventricosus]GBL99880.1 hypothetical protein AVEN_120663-1 [Araneus ventricosus]GBL99896.1 hypothetical protein AVEN_141414-1 [Araneus ventricosus]GBL99915.1 hypothetical protein AVEN_205431-1 [Araneus ventricosus]
MGVERLLQMKYVVREDFETFAWKFKDLYLEWRADSQETEIAQALVDRLPEEHQILLGIMQFQTVREVIVFVNRYISLSPGTRGPLLLPGLLTREQHSQY